MKILYHTFNEFCLIRKCKVEIQFVCNWYIAKNTFVYGTTGLPYFHLGQRTDPCRKNWNCLVLVPGSSSSDRYSLKHHNVHLYTCLSSSLNLQNCFIIKWKQEKAMQDIWLYIKPWFQDISVSGPITIWLQTPWLNTPNGLSSKSTSAS